MYWEVYAYILDGIVKDVSVFDPHGGYTLANSIAKSIYGDTALAVNVSALPVQEGDTYSDGAFYHDGELVKSVDVVGDKIYEVEQGVGELGQLIASILGG